MKDILMYISEAREEEKRQIEYMKSRIWNLHETLLPLNDQMILYCGKYKQLYVCEPKFRDGEWSLIVNVHLRQPIGFLLNKTRIEEVAVFEFVMRHKRPYSYDICDFFIHNRFKIGVYTDDKELLRKLAKELVGLKVKPVECEVPISALSLSERMVEPCDSSLSLVFDHCQ